MKPATVFLALLAVLMLKTGCSPVKEGAMLDEAEALIKQLDYNEAKKRFEATRASVPANSEDWVRASYGLMLARWHASPASAENINAAKAIGEELLASDAVEPQMKYRVELDIARIDEVADFQGDPLEIDAARASYRDIQETASDPAIAYEAMLRLANTYRKEVEPESLRMAESIILEHIENAPEVTYWTSMAWQILGEMRGMELRDHAGALAAYEEALKRGFVNRNQHDLYFWSMGYWAEQTGKIDRAIELYTVIAAEMPRSTYQTIARKRISELGGSLPSEGDRL